MKQSAKTTPLTHHGPVQWRLLTDWMREDGVITAAEAERTIARCSRAESAQPALVQLAAVGIGRASDGRPMDVEELTQYLALRAQAVADGMRPLRLAEVIAATPSL
ncbi:MAG: hypothetical protein FWG56_02005 [Desulfovibrionaceae bacterium]|nr:hypothetical protein [Desulfovibrionaceae bacterium]